MTFDKATARVLIVEDDLELRTALGDLLALEGIAFVLARTGEEALAVLAATPPTLILLDLQMPQMDGPEFRKRQLANAEWAKIPVVVLSADRAIASFSRSMQVADFLLKPINVARLIGLIERWA